MNSSRSLRSPRGAANKEPHRPFVYLYKIDFPENQPVRIRLPKDMKELLKIATEVLELVRQAKQVFDEHNNPITDISKIEPRSNLYISCADAPKDEENEPIYKSRLPKFNKTANSLKLPIIKQPKAKPKRDDAAQHQALAASPYTVRENLRDSIVSLYASLTPEHIAQLGCKESLQKLTDDTKQYVVENALITQLIGPTSVISNTDLGKQTTQWMMNNLKGLKAEDCRFAITGPTQSGKSTLLNIAVNLFHQKCQVAGETQNYLIVPINWTLHQIYIDDLPRLYGVMVSATLNALRGSHFELIPIMPALQQWFLSIVTIPALPPLPPCVLHFKAFPHTVVAQIGAQIHKAWNHKAGLALFLDAMITFPRQIAAAFGYKSAVPVFDHFDSAGVMIDPTDRFDESESVCITDVLCDSLITGPFFVASHDDTEFFSLFGVGDYHQLSTERILEKVEGKELHIADPSFTLTPDMCRGCPAYVAMYENLVQCVSQVTEKAAVKSQFSRLKSVVDESRKETMRQELVRVCLLLAGADTDNLFDADFVNALTSMSDITIKIH